jgi:hypothetical protein
MLVHMIQQYTAVRFLPASALSTELCHTPTCSSATASAALLAEPQPQASHISALCPAAADSASGSGASHSHSKSSANTDTNPLTLSGESQDMAFVPSPQPAGGRISPSRLALHGLLHAGHSHGSSLTASSGPSTAHGGQQQEHTSAGAGAGATSAGRRWQHGSSQGDAAAAAAAGARGSASRAQLVEDEYEEIYIEEEGEVQQRYSQQRSFRAAEGALVPVGSTQLAVGRSPLSAPQPAYWDNSQEWQGSMSGRRMSGVLTMQEEGVVEVSCLGAGWHAGLPAGSAGHCYACTCMRSLLHPLSTVPHALTSCICTPSAISCMTLLTPSGCVHQLCWLSAGLAVLRPSNIHAAHTLTCTPPSATFPQDLVHSYRSGNMASLVRTIAVTDHSARSTSRTGSRAASMAGSRPASMAGSQPSTFRSAHSPRSHYSNRSHHSLSGFSLRGSRAEHGSGSVLAGAPWVGSCSRAPPVSRTNQQEQAAAVLLTSDDEDDRESVGSAGSHGW